MNYWFRVVVFSSRAIAARNASTRSDTAATPTSAAAGRARANEPVIHPAAVNAVGPHVDHVSNVGDGLVEILHLHRPVFRVMRLDLLENLVREEVRKVDLESV
jgi:hypothetical protein